MRAPVTLISFGLLLAALSLSACKPKAPEVDAKAEEAKAAQAAKALEAAKTAAWDFYKTQPPYMRPRPYSATPKGLGNMEAETCGACHQEIYKEWSLSTHRRAWKDDAQFQKELEKSRGAHTPKGETPKDVSWMCVNCHTPLMNQQQQWVVGLEGGDLSKPKYVANPQYDPDFEDDAITCGTCHVRDGVIYGPYGDTKAPHPTAKDEALLTESVCTSCHQATAQFPELTLGCFFTTGQEFAQFKATPSGADHATCQSCHMPEVERKIAESFDVPVRKTRRHWFGGSLIPKKPQYAQELEPLEAVYGSGASFEVLSGAQALSDEPKPECASEASTPCSLALLRITNKHAGHGLPTGDPERHIIITATVTDAAGQTLSTKELFIGDRYQWWPTIKRTLEARLMPGQSREAWITLDAKHQEATLKIEAVKYRMHKDAFDYHKLEGDYVRGRTFHTSTWRLSQGSPPELISREDDKPVEDAAAP